MTCGCQLVGSLLVDAYFSTLKLRLLAIILLVSFDIFNLVKVNSRQRMSTLKCRPELVCNYSQTETRETNREKRLINFGRLTNEIADQIDDILHSSLKVSISLVVPNEIATPRLQGRVGGAGGRSVVRQENLTRRLPSRLPNPALKRFKKLAVNSHTHTHRWKEKETKLTNESDQERTGNAAMLLFRPIGCCSFVIMIVIFFIGFFLLFLLPNKKTKIDSKKQKTVLDVERKKMADSQNVGRIETMGLQRKVEEEQEEQEDGHWVKFSSGPRLPTIVL